MPMKQLERDMDTLRDAHMTPAQRDAAQKIAESARLMALIDASPNDTSHGAGES